MTDTTFDMHIIEPAPVICPKCREEGRKSVVYDYGTDMTMAHYPAFYDEDGRRHEHDRNSRTMDCRCSNGHNFKLPVDPPLCPTCGEWWKARTLT